MARLPVPGGDDGQWGTILNDFLGQSLKSDGMLKDDIVTSSNVADGALPQAKITNLTTDLSNKVTTTDARLKPDNVSDYPSEGYGFFATSDLPSVCTEDSTTGVGTLIGARVWVPANNAVNSVSAYVNIAGTLSGGGTNGFAIYSDSGTLVSSTTSNNNLWSSTGWRTGTFGSAIAAQSTGRFVYVCMLVVGYSSAPEIMWHSSHPAMSSPSPGTTGKRAFFDGGGNTSFPASFNPATIGTTATFIPLFGLA